MSLPALAIKSKVKNDMDGGEVDFWAKLPPTRRKAGREVFTQTMDGGAGVIPGVTDTQLL